MPLGLIPFPFGKCRICHDKATGLHYGVATCEGCKGFFKRSTIRDAKYKCFFGGDCEVTPKNRNRCKSCRFKRCQEVGMALDAVRMGRIPKVEKEKVLEVFHQCGSDYSKIELSAQKRGTGSYDFQLNKSVDNTVESDSDNQDPGTSSLKEGVSNKEVEFHSNTQNDLQGHDSSKDYFQRKHTINEGSNHANNDQTKDVSHTESVEYNGVVTFKYEQDYEMCNTEQRKMKPLVNLYPDLTDSIEDPSMPIQQDWNPYNDSCHVQNFTTSTALCPDDNPNLKSPTQTTTVFRSVFNPYGPNPSFNHNSGDESTKNILHMDQTSVVNHNFMGKAKDTEILDLTFDHSSYTCPIVTWTQPSVHTGKEESKVPACRFQDGGEKVGRKFIDLKFNQDRHIATSNINPEASINQSSFLWDESHTASNLQLIPSSQYSAIPSTFSSSYSSLPSQDNVGQYPVSSVQLMCPTQDMLSQSATLKMASCKPPRQACREPCSFQTDSGKVEDSQTSSPVKDQDTKWNSFGNPADRNSDSETSYMDCQSLSSRSSSSSRFNQSILKIVSDIITEASARQRLTDRLRQILSSKDRGSVEPLINMIQNEFQNILTQVSMSHETEERIGGDAMTKKKKQRDEVDLLDSKKKSLERFLNDIKRFTGEHFPDGPSSQVHDISSSQQDCGLKTSWKQEDVLWGQSSSDAGESCGLEQEEIETALVSLNLAMKILYRLKPEHRDKIRLKRMGKIKIRVMTDSDEDVAFVYDRIITSIPMLNERVFGFCEHVPYFSELKKEDKSKLIKRAYYDIWMLTFSEYFRNGESEMILSTGEIYSIEAMRKILNDNMVDTILKFSEQFNALKLSDLEISILCAIQLTRSDGMELEDRHSVSRIHSKLLKLFFLTLERNHPTDHSHLIACIFQLLPLLEEINHLQKTIIANFPTKFPNKQNES